MAKPDRKLSKAAKAAKQEAFASLPSEAAPTVASQPVAEVPASVNVAAAIHQEIYQMLKRGEYYPGYTIVPAHKADTNSTVEKILLEIAGDALVKLKEGSDKKFIATNAHFKNGVVRGADAQALEQMGFDRPRN